MINISLIHKNGNIVKIKVYGHSEYDISGRDIVCAAVSSLSQSLIVGLQKVICGDFFYEVDEESADLYIDVSKYNEENLRDAQILFMTFKYTLEEIIKEYGKYVKLRMKEDK